jgi:predicted dehydrogenase
MRFAIVGCGLIGHKRSRFLNPRHTLAVAADLDLARAESLASQWRDARAVVDWKQAVEAPGVEAVIVAVTNDCLAPITAAAIQAGRHVIVEKPAARTVKELQPVMELAASCGVHVQAGFNHRYHPAFRKAREICDAGSLGELMFVRARYGHGGRRGYDREWRADPEVAGGGELLDQGVHLIDLARWFLGEFPHVHGCAPTFFWNMPVEDNGFLMLRTETGQVAWLHASCTEWKNTFSFEIYGRRGKLHVEGLGGSYGVERLAYYRMLPQMGPPETTIWEYPGEDRSWEVELTDFERAVNGDRAGVPGLQDAHAALTIVEEIYRVSRPDYRKKPHATVAWRRRHGSSILLP